MRTNMYTKQGLWSIFFVMLFFTIKANDNLGYPLVLNCPSDVYVSCTDELWNLSCYGNATYTYRGQTYSAGSPSVSYYLNSCNAGYITRTWMVEDYNWNWYNCTQYIYVSTSGTGGPNIYWPDDIELTGCNPDINPYHLPDPNNYPTWDEGTCSMLGKSYSDMEFWVNNQCRKIMRTWKVMDWCDYSPQYGYKIYSHVQIIYIRDNTAPVFTCPAEITVNSFNCKNTEVNADPLTVNQSSCGGYFDITNNSPYAYKKGSDLSGIYPVGTTKVTFTVKYACGKTKTCNVNVIVKNANKPTPYCLGYMTTALMPVDNNKDGIPEDGMVEVSAKIFDKGSFSSCGNYPIKFSFSKDVNETTRIFTCEHVGKNIVKMWVTDSKGAQEFCEVELIIQNNGAKIPNCQPKPKDPDPDPKDSLNQINGNVLTLTDTPLKNATMTARYHDPIITYTYKYDTTEILVLDSFINASGYKLYRYEKKKVITTTKDSTLQYVFFNTLTDSLGRYAFDSLPYGNKKIDIYGSYNDAPNRFIDDKDVELLKNFLNGKIKFLSFHQYLASDINEDGIIDDTDKQILEDLVNGKITTLPGSHQWYLLDKKAKYTKPEDVLSQPLPLVVSLDSLVKKHGQIDFIAIKKGNISVDPGSLKEDVRVYTRAIPVEGVSVSAHPNPFRDRMTFIVGSDINQTTTLKLYNLAGQIIVQQEYRLSKGENIIEVQVDNQYEGMLIYQWQIHDQMYNGKITKVK